MSHRITAFGVACAFLVCCIVAVWAMMTFSGCAMLDSLLQPHYKTFELTIDSHKVVVNLPNELPSMDKAIKAKEQCFNAGICRQQFCVTKEVDHDHVDFLYVGTDVKGLVWIKEQETESEKRYTAWIYVEKKPISVPIATIQALIKEHRPK